MADTATLRDSDLDDFLAFAKRMGYESLPTRRDFEVLRLKKGHAPTVVFCRRARDPQVIWAERGEATKLVHYWAAFKQQGASK
jgi:hypothetical protein